MQTGATPSKCGRKVILGIQEYCPWKESAEERDGFVMLPTLFSLPMQEQTVLHGISSDSVQAAA